MALTNMPEFPNTENNEGITNPSPLPEQPCGACFPPPRKPMFTVQEEFIETRHRVNETLARVLNLQKHIETTLNSLSSSLSADNETFKNLTINTYNEFSKTVVDEVNSFEASITNAFKVLDESLNSDFTNIVVQQNKKIDEAHTYMTQNLESNVEEGIKELVENGTMSELINEELLAQKISVGGAETLVNDAVAGLEAKIAFNTNSINNAHNRISGLSSLSQGSTTGDAELIDMRRAVTGNYGSAGDALRGEITAVLNRITAIEGNKKILKGYSMIPATEEEATMTDVDFFPPNSIISIAYPESRDFLLNLPYHYYGETKVEFLGTIITFSQSGLNDGGRVQLAFRNDGTTIYFRTSWGAEAQWKNWERVVNKTMYDTLSAEVEANTTMIEYVAKEMVKYTSGETASYISIFPVVGCIGDSLSSGESTYTKADGSTGYADMYEHSWGQHIARSSGIKVHNFSAGGLTTRSWLTAGRGLALAKTEGNECNAYIIALGVNDRNSLGLDYLGSIDDIGSDKDTYYANYSRIISEMKAIQPKAKFFLMLDPKQSATEGFNLAVKNIAETLDNCYVVDMTKHDYKFTSGGTIAKHDRNGHYNSIGYKKIGDIINKEISSVIMANYDEFAEVEFIGTDYTA